MSINPNQGQKPDPNDPYGAYSGYAPQQPAQSAQPNSDDPYNSQWYGQQGGAQQTGGYGTGQQQSYGTGQQQQTYQQTYQPPRSAYNTSSTSDPSGPSTMSMNPRIAALLSNALIWFGGLFFFFAERKNRFVRFNAAQSTLFFGSLFIVYGVINVLGVVGLIPFLGLFLGFVVGFIIGAVHILLILLGVMVWLFLCFQAYRGAKTKLPFFGDYAERLVARFTR